MSEPRVRLDRVSFRDFRNLEKLDLELPDAGLAIIGENGQGKTNLLEGIYYMQVLRSVRGARDHDLVRFGARAFHIAGRVESDSMHELTAAFETAGKRKKVTRDGAVAARLSDAFGSLPSVIFSPRDIELVAGAPSERRRYLDLVLALSSRRYLAALQHYRAALARRNAALRNVARRGGDEAAIAVWEPSLAEHGATLVCERSRWASENAERFSRLATAIGEAGHATMSYTRVPRDAEADPRPGAEKENTRSLCEDDVRGTLEAALARQRKHDLKRGVTHSGPHRDDLDLALAGRDLRVFGSAGQQRTAAIALRMLEGATLRAAEGAEPILLLDDPFAELDERRSGNILELLRSTGLGQTILVVPRATDIPPGLVDLERRRITGGRIEAAA